MDEKGQVIEIKNENVIIKMQRQEACAKCRACINGLIGKEMRVEAKNKCNAKVGDWVLIDLQNEYFLKAVFIMYCIPLAAFFFGILLGYYGSLLWQLYYYKEPIALVTGIIFTLIAGFLIHKNEGHFKKQNYSPAAIAIVEEES